MLRINISSDVDSELTFTELEKYEIPAPRSGFNPEVNDTVVMQFEDEQEAIDYAHDLDEFAESIQDEDTSENSPVRNVIADIIKAISDDEFVQAYIQS